MGGGGVVERRGRAALGRAQATRAAFAFVVAALRWCFMFYKCSLSPFFSLFFSHLRSRLITFLFPFFYFIFPFKISITYKF